MVSLDLHPNSQSPGCSSPLWVLGGRLEATACHQGSMSYMAKWLWAKQSMAPGHHFWLLSAEWLPQWMGQMNGFSACHVLLKTEIVSLVTDSQPCPSASPGCSKLNFTHFEAICLLPVDLLLIAWSHTLWAAAEEVGVPGLAWVPIIPSISHQSHEAI
jgi:hypothetical protein